MRGKDRVQGCLRIFVSSTFRDMQAERDALAARTFPKLRAIAEKGGRGLQEIDLRWGVTEEEAQTGEVTDICLDEIDACRPFFVLMLGERYGWIDPDGAERLARRHPHLVAFAGRSVTEIEVRHALLNVPAHQHRCHALVYVRSADGEGPNADGHIGSAEQLAVSGLLAELRASSAHIRTYRSPVELAELMEADLGPLIERAAPPHVGSDAEREQAAFRTLHAATGFHGQRALSKLLRLLWFRRRIVVEGGAGSGKSALLIALYNHLNARAQPGGEAHLIALAASGGSFARAITTLPSSDGGAHLQLDRLSATHPGAVLIDGPEVAGDDVFGDALAWLPTQRPRGQLIVATRSAALAKALAAEGFRYVRLPERSAGERRTMLRQVLAAYGKVLSASQEARILRHKAGGNPAFIRAFAEELRHEGLFEQLDNHIGGLLVRPDAVGILTAALERLEQIEGVPHDLPRQALRLIMAARLGLAERELLTVLGGGRRPLPMRAWSPVRLALQPFLIERGSILGIESEALRDAIVHRYGASPDELGEERAQLAAYFLRAPTEPRAIDELTFLLPANGQWQVLADLIADPAWLMAAHQRDATALEGLASAVVNRAPEHRQRMLAPLTRLASDSAHGDACIVAGEVLGAAGEPDDALAAASAALATLPTEQSGLRQRLLELKAQGQIRSGRLDEALTTLSEVRRTTGQAVPQPRLWEQTALLALESGHVDIARQLLQDAIGAGVRNLEQQARLEAHLATADLLAGQTTKARDTFREVAKRARRIGAYDVLALALSGEGLSLRTSGKVRRALGLFEQEEALWRRRGDRAALARCLTNQALCHIDADDFDRADAVLTIASGEAQASGDRRLQSAILRRNLELLDRLGLGQGARADTLRAAAMAITLAAAELRSRTS